MVASVYFKLETYDMERNFDRALLYAKIRA